MAIGITPALARGSIRFPFGKWSTEADIKAVMEVLPRTIDKLRAISPLFKRSSQESSNVIGK